MQEFVLGPRKELRFIVPDKLANDNIVSSAVRKHHVRLKKGTAEIFGVNLLLNSKDKPDDSYELRPGSYALYTWYGCTVEINTSRCLKVYEESDTLQELYASINGNLELLRSKGLHKDKGGPRVAVVGSEGVGKTTVAKTLAAYCARCEQSQLKIARTSDDNDTYSNVPIDTYGPVYVDLDTRANSLSIPGCISALADFKSLNLTVKDGIVNKGALSFFVGYENPSDVPELFSTAVERLARAIHDRLSRNNVKRHSGVIIDTFALGVGTITEETDYKLLKHALEVLKVDIILVLGLDRLASDLKTDLDAVTSGSSDPTGIHILKIPQSGAAVKKSPVQKKVEQARAFKRYFEGSEALPLAPHRKTFLLKTPKIDEDEIEGIETDIQTEVKIWKIQDKVFASEALLPVGEEATIKPSNAAQLTQLTESLIGQVLGISYSTDENEILYLQPMKNIAGFAFVESVDVEKNKLTLLLPSPVDLPTTNLLLGELKWTEL